MPAALHALLIAVRSASAPLSPNSLPLMPRTSRHDHYARRRGPRGRPSPAAMGRQARVGLGVLLAAGIIAALATTAAAQTSGGETFDGTIIASANASGDRTV